MGLAPFCGGSYRFAKIAVQISAALAGRSIDWTGRYRGRASALVRPGSTDEVVPHVVDRATFAGLSLGRYCHVAPTRCTRSSSHAQRRAASR
jgi:hypothetical protein